MLTPTSSSAPRGFDLMRIEIDQSGRIEDTRVHTVLAFSDKLNQAILIPARVKREAFRYLRERYQLIKYPALKPFAAGLFLLLKPHLHQLQLITIDVEFEGHEGHIKGMLLSHIRKVVPGFPKERVAFRSIGKKSRAHLKALRTYRKEGMPDRVVALQELIALL